MIRVRIPPVLRASTGGEREVATAGGTVGAVLDDLTSRFPDLEQQLPYANVYVDGEDIRTLDELETPVGEGATIILLPAMAGGLASSTGVGSRRAASLAAPPSEARRRGSGARPGSADT